MALSTPLKMMGAPGSPYTRKMRAVLRYRRIPFVFLMQNSPELADMPKAKPELLPTFFLPDDAGEVRAYTDSTPLIRRFEREFEGRSIIPPDPASAFLDELLEDFADEWLTKCMFHYRWSYDVDATKARRVLPHWMMHNVSDEEIAPVQQMFGDRQTGRLGVVGSSEMTAPVIEESYRAFLAAFDAQLQTSRFFFGERPASSDFATMGQLTAMALFDPTPSALTANVAPRVHAWTESTEDLSGIERDDSDWKAASELSDSLRAVFSEVGRFYAPFLLANAKAVESGAEQVETGIAGQPWVSKPFSYQKKCLGWLRDSYASLRPEAKHAVDAFLEGTGCEALFV